MGLSNYFTMAVIAGALFLLTGCVDNSIPEEKNLGNSVPRSANDPRNYGNSSNSVTGLELGDGGDGFASGATDASLGGAGDANSIDGWTPVEGVEFPIVYFEFDRDTVTPAEMEKIKQAASYMAQYPELGLIIEGHTDDVGTNEYNRVLGERRAISTMNAFGENGLGAERIKTISYGEDQPDANGADAQARALNRRAVLLPAQMQ